MKKEILYILLVLLTISNSKAQHIYKDQKFLGGYFHFTSSALKDITLNGNSIDNNGDEYWNNSPFNENQPRDIEIRAKIRANIIYGYFPLDKFAFGGNLNISSNSFNEEDTLVILDNRSFDIGIGPFLRYYIEIGGQPYEIGAIFLEGKFNVGHSYSKDNIEFTINDTNNISLSESYNFFMTVATAKIGFSWYLSDFLSHNWFTGAHLSLEPNISYNWTTKQSFVGNKEKQKYRGIHYNIALVAYL